MLWGIVLNFYLNFGSRISSMSKFIEVALFNALRFAFSPKNAYVNLEVTYTADKMSFEGQFPNFCCLSPHFQL